MKLLVRPPQLLRSFYKGSYWRMDKIEPIIYLTFDDGPIPELTPWVLDILAKYQVKATFFCVGDNILKILKYLNASKMKVIKLEIIHLTM